MIQADADLSRLDRATVNVFQGGFPVVERPFEPAAAALRERGVDVLATDLCERVRTLDEEGILSRFGTLVDAEEIGSTATLAAMHAPPERLDEVAGQVSDHHEVAHNYEREHPHLNMWFVASAADESRAEEAFGDIEDEAGQVIYNMSKRHGLYVGAKFLPDGPISDGDPNLSHLGPDVEPTNARTLTPDERDLVMEIQGGLLITEMPHADVAEAIGQEPAWVVKTVKRSNLEGKVHRVGVIPSHCVLGHSENGMAVWNVPDNLVAEADPEIVSLDFVTHCYRRPRHEGVWSYNSFAMTHGRSEEESEARIEQVREVMNDYWDVGDDDWDIPLSTHILKKTEIRLDE